MKPKLLFEFVATVLFLLTLFAFSHCTSNHYATARGWAERHVLKP